MTPSPEQLPVRRLGIASATAVVIASMIGTGVFTTTGFLVEALGSPFTVLAAWVVAGALALCGALSYAELAAALPRNGGEYQLLGRIYHPAVGFIAGVISLVVGFAAPLSASALAFGHYLAVVFPVVPPVGAAMGIIVLAALAHGLDVAWGARAQHLMTFVQIAVIAVMIAVGLTLGQPARVVDASTRFTADALLSPQFAVALIFVSFAYSGWNGAVYLAGEVKTPARTLPIALIAGTTIVAVLYVGVNVVMLAAVPARELAGVVEVANTAAVRLVGAGGGRLLSAVIAFALASSVSAMLMAGPRVYEAMGRDYSILEALAYRTRRGAPLVSVAVQTALALVMVVTATFGWLLGFIGFTLSICAMLTVVGVVVLRYREPDLPRTYRAWGYPVTPILFAGLSTWMALHSIVEQPASSLAGLAVIVVSALAYGVVMRVGKAGKTAVLT